MTTSASNGTTETPTTLNDSATNRQIGGSRLTLTQPRGPQGKSQYSIDRFVRDIDPREKVRLGGLEDEVNRSSTQRDETKGDMGQGHAQE